MDQDLDIPLRLLLGHAGVDLGVGLTVLLLGRRAGRLVLAPATLGRAVGALVAAGIAALLGAAAAVWLFGIDPLFGSIHLLFFDVLLVAPILGLAMLATTNWQSAGRSAAMRVLLGGLLVLGGACGAWAHWVEPFLINVERPTVVAGQLTGPIRIGILADLQTDHVTDHERRAVDRLLAAEPDLILIPGDIFQGSRADFEREREPLRALLGRLKAPYGVYAVIGNSDRPEPFRRALEGLEIQWLHNRVHTITTAVGKIIIGGVTYSDVPAVGEVQSRVGRLRADGRLAVVLSHDPGVNWIHRGERYQPDLIVAGHTHGGQIRLPLIGAPITLTRYPRRYASGAHREGETVYYVSRGVGVERKQAPRIRFLCPPEVTILSVVPRERPSATATAAGDPAPPPPQPGSPAGEREGL